MENFYDKWAEKYDEIPKCSSAYESNQYAAQKSVKYIKDKENAILLELPCGTGMTGRLCKKLVSVILMGQIYRMKCLKKQKENEFLEKFSRALLLIHQNWIVRIILMMRSTAFCFVLFCFVILFNGGHNTKIAHIYLHI